MEDGIDAVTGMPNNQLARDSRATDVPTPVQDIVDAAALLCIVHPATWRRHPPLLADAATRDVASQLGRKKARNK